MRLFLRYITAVFCVLMFLGHSPILQAQPLEYRIEANLMKALIIDMEVEFSVEFNADNQDVILVRPSLEQIENDESQKNIGIRPTIVRVTGGAAEALVDVETSDISIDNNGGEGSIRLYDFNIVNKETGAHAIVMPDSSKDSFLLSVGGKVDGFNEEEIFTSVNILNLNYL